MSIETSVFGTTNDGRQVTRYRLANSGGASLSVMSFGATLLEVQVPDKTGNLANVNWCFDKLDPYVNGHPYFGSTVGRFCNRIGNAKFTIDDKQHNLTVNHGEHILHGGIANFSYQLWNAEPFEEADRCGVRFRLESPDGHEGFPGCLNVVTEYSWNERCELTIAFTATTDAPTHVNLTNHSYWNLAGVGSGTALDHEATIYADELLDVDGDLIPTGKLNSVEGTVFDFREPRAFRQNVHDLPATKGYDHCFVVKGIAGELRPAARVIDPSSGRVLEIETTQPGMQLYTANHLPGDAGSAGAGGHDAFCLETQHYPDAPNKPSFPSTLLRPGDTLAEKTVHRFSVA